MKINQVFLCCLFIGLSCYGLQGQTAADALRFNELLPSGTARMVGVGGAMSSLGGDMGSLSINPAGLGVYRKSEFNLSPAVQFTGVGSTLNDGSENNRNASKFGIENIGLVFYKEYRNDKLKAFNFSATLNRIANFNRTVEYEGASAGSIVNAFQADAQGLFDADLDGFTSGIASDAEAIFNLDGAADTEWFSDFDTFEDINLDRKETITTTGGVSDLAFNLAVNISHKLYIGGGLTLPMIRFEETRSYEEEDSADDVPFFRNLVYEQRIETTGTGIGFRGGFIYRITNAIRLGGGVHSPIRYTLTDDFTTSLDYFFIDELDPSQPLIRGEGVSPEGNFQYRLKTPWRINGGLAVVLKKFGFVSLDVEQARYSDLEYNFQASDAFTQNVEDQVNQEINTDFRNTLNVKIGAEYLIKKFRIRAGYGVYGSPFEGGDARNVLSFGAGIRAERVFFDLAFRNTSAEENYSPYNSPNEFSQDVFSDISTNNLIATFGYRF